VQCAGDVPPFLVLRLGARVARLRPKDVSMEDAVAAMTGALTFHEDEEEETS